MTDSPTVVDFASGWWVTDLLTSETVNLLAVSFGVGIVIGLTGIGGGALMTPALIFLNIPPAAAVANDLVAAAVNKSVGAFVHWRNGSPNVRLAGWLIAGSVPTAFAGAFIVDTVGTKDEQAAFLKTAIGLTLLLAAATYGARAYLSNRRQVGERAVVDVTIRPVLTLLLGAVGGLLVGLTSVGSGSVIMVVLLLMHPQLSPVKLVGTDLVQAIPLVASAALGHVIVSGVDAAILIPLIIGGSPGTFLGARMANWVPQQLIRRAVVIVLLLTGLGLLQVPPVGIASIGAGLLSVVLAHQHMRRMFT